MRNVSLCHFAIADYIYASDMLLNLDQRVRESIQESIEKLDEDPDNRPSMVVFDELEALVVNQIANDTMRKWHETALCQEALANLIARHRQVECRFALYLKSNSSKQIQAKYRCGHR